MAIQQLCPDPAETRDRAAAGEAVPCYRCLAYEPGVGRGCRFLNRPTTPWSKTSREETDQMPLFRTSDKLEEET